jgi:hypothetical protein
MPDDVKKVAMFAGAAIVSVIVGLVVLEVLRRRAGVDPVASLVNALSPTPAATVPATA